MSSSAITTNPYQAKSSDVQNSDGSSLATKVVTGMVVTDSPLMFRNRIINGDMRISQRYDNVAAHTISTGQIFYTVDRFFVLAAGANVTGQRIAGTGVNPYVYRVTGAASNTQCLLIQRIEAANTEDLVNKTVTLQFEASATGITSLDYEIRIATVRDTFTTTTSVTSGTVTVSTTPTVFTVTTTLPAGATNGVQINLGKTSGLVASQTFSISGVQLEAGPVATPFERRPIGMELALCQRYYYRLYSSSNFGPFAFGIAKSTTQASTIFNLPVSMRVIPTGVDTSAANTFQISDAVTVIVVSTAPVLISSQSTTNTMVLDFTVASGLTQFRPYRAEAATNTNSYIGVSAEL